MKTLTALPLVVIGGALFLLSGYGDDNSMMSQETSLVAQTVPVDGEAAFEPAAPIQIKFRASMDTPVGIMQTKVKKQSTEDGE